MWGLLSYGVFLVAACWWVLSRVMPVDGDIWVGKATILVAFVLAPTIAFAGAFVCYELRRLAAATSDVATAVRQGAVKMATEEVPEAVEGVTVLPAPTWSRRYEGPVKHGRA